jgi:hypothetical protein
MGAQHDGTRSSNNCGGQQPIIDAEAWQQQQQQQYVCMTDIIQDGDIPGSSFDSAARPAS